VGSPELRRRAAGPRSIEIRQTFRIMSRPWAADEFMSKIMSEFVEKPKSLAKLITYSQVIKDMFANNRAQCKEDVPISKDVRDFAFAPQRYDSEAKVLLRLCLTFDASITTACQVICLRGGASDEGAACIDLLTFLDDEVALQLGMMADCAREIFRLVEACDCSDLDEADLPNMVEECECILQHLFTKGQCMHVPGMTSLMVKTLQRPRTYLIRGAPKTVGRQGELPTEIINRCLRRMAVYTVVAKSVLRGEFPDWDLLSSFQVFALSESRARSRSTTVSECNMLLGRLGSALSLDHTDVVEQYHKFQPLAHKLYLQQKRNNFEAWKQALLLRRQRSHSRDVHRSDALLAVLTRYGTWTSSSSDNERGFAQSSALRQGKSEDTFAAKEESIMILRSDRVSGEALDKLVKDASRLWIKHYGRPAAPPAMERAHKGLPMPKRRRTGEASYLRTRDHITTSLTGELGQILPSKEFNVTEADLSAKQKRELAFNAKKEQVSKIEALISGTLDESHVDAELLEAAVAHMDNLTKKQHELNLEKARKVKALVKPKQSVLGAKVFFETGCNSFSASELHSWQVDVCDKRGDANLFIVKVIENASPKVQLVAKIVGARIATSVYLKTGGREGACVAYAPAMSTRRHVYISDGFIELHPHVCADLHYILSVIDCKWVLTESVAKLVEFLGHGATRKRRQREVLIFLTSSEKGDEDSQDIETIVEWRHVGSAFRLLW